MSAPQRPIPFSMKQEALQHNPGRPLDRNTEQALRTRIARQQVTQPGRVAQQEQFGGRPGNGQPAYNPPQPRQQTPQGERGFRQVPRPPVNQQQPAAQNDGQRGGYPPANKPARNGEQMAPAYRTVPRPPEKGNGSQSGFHSFGSPQGQPHSVAQPPAQENRPQPGFRSFGSPQGQPHSAPQPPASTENGNRYGRSPQVEQAQPRNQGNQPNAGSGRFNRGGNQGGPVARPNNSRPNPEPARVERQAPHPEAAQSGGREVRSHESNPPPQHNQNSKDESKPDKKH